LQPLEKLERQLLLDESIERCAQASAVLGARLREVQRQAESAREHPSAAAARVGKAVLSPLSRGFAWLKRLQNQASEGLVAGLDVLLPPPPSHSSDHVISFRITRQCAQRQAPDHMQLRSSEGNWPAATVLILSDRQRVQARQREQRLQCNPAGQPWIPPPDEYYLLQRFVARE